MPSSMSSNSHTTGRSDSILQKTSTWLGLLTRCTPCITKARYVAVFCEHPGFLTRAMEVFRKIESDRPVVCLFEDIDAIIDVFEQSHHRAVGLDLAEDVYMARLADPVYPVHHQGALRRRLLRAPRLLDAGDGGLPQDRVRPPGGVPVRRHRCHHRCLRTVTPPGGRTRSCRRRLHGSAC